VPGTIDCANLSPVKNRKDGYSKEKTQIIKAGITIVCGIIEHETENKMVEKSRCFSRYVPVMDSPHLSSVRLVLVLARLKTFVHAQVLPEIVVTAEIFVTTWERASVRCVIQCLLAC
jgi:bisphosphoglycerate-dependent phosphoglycerate mutase